MFVSFRKEVKVTKIFNHPQYNCNSYSYRNDIALLKLAEEVDLTSYTPACLSDSEKNYTGQVGLATGRSNNIFLSANLDSLPL